MTRQWIRSTAVALLLPLLPATLSAQTYLFLGGGGTFPSGSYGDYAETGWLASGGAGFYVGPEGMSVVVEGFYGQNNHKDLSQGVDEKTNPYGVMAEVLYEFGTGGKVRPYLLGGAGLLVHKFGTNQSYGGASESQFGYTAGAGVSIPAGKTLNIYGEGRYFGSSDTQFFGVLAGVSLTLGGGGD